MSSIAPPSVRPRPKGFGRYWTLHSAGNNAFTLQLKEEFRMSVVGFKSKTDATLIAKMIETYYVSHQMEWPELKGEFELPRPLNLLDSLSYIHIVNWDFEDLKMTCVRNVLDLVSVDGLVTTKDGYSFEGNLYKFEGDLEFYKSRFEEFME